MEISDTFGHLCYILYFSNTNGYFIFYVDILFTTHNTFIEIDYIRNTMDVW